MHLKPTHDLVFIEKKATEQVGSIIITNNKEEPRGIVVAHGPGKMYSDGNIVPLTVQVGDEVIYSKHAGQTFLLHNVELIAIREDDIYVVVKSK